MQRGLHIPELELKAIGKTRILHSVTKKNVGLHPASDDQSGSLSDRWKTKEEARSKYQPRTRFVNFPRGIPCAKSKNAFILIGYFGTAILSLNLS